MARETTAEERARLWLNYGIEYRAKTAQRMLEHFGSMNNAQAAFADGDEAFSTLPETV